MDVTTREAVMELWELIAWLLSRLLGSVHQTDVATIVRVFGIWAGSDDIFSRINTDGVANVAGIIGNIIGVLKGCLGKRKKNPVVTADVLHRSNEAAKNANGNSGGGGGRQESSMGTPVGGVKKTTMKKSVSTGFLAGLDSTEDLSRQASDASTGDAAVAQKRFAKMQPFRQASVFTDNVRDKIREELRTLLQSLRNMLKVKSGISADGQDLVDRITFVLSMESGMLSYAILSLSSRDTNIPILVISYQHICTLFLRTFLITFVVFDNRLLVERCVRILTN